MIKIKVCWILFSFLLLACDPNSKTRPLPSGSLSLSLLGGTYLDYAASWDINEAALVEFIAVSKILGNSSGINPHSEYLRKLELHSTKIISDKIHDTKCISKNKATEPDLHQIHFVTSASLANNIAILGVAYKNPGCHFITSKIEHKSILNVFKHLEKKGYEVTYLDVDRYGKIDFEQLKKSIRSNTKLISVQMVNSEIGVLQDLVSIGRLAKENGILFHSDASQAFCKYPINVDAIGLDLLTISGYKIGAPKGIAALYVRAPEKLQPIFFGSGDPFFPGTKPTALICSFAKAVETFSFNIDKVRRNYGILQDELLKTEGGGIYINSSAPSHVFSVSIERVLLKDVLEQTKGLSSFSAGCSCLGQDRSNVIAAIDPSGKLPQCTLRLSFSDKVDSKKLKIFAKKLRKIIQKLRKNKKVRNGCEHSVNPEKNGSKQLDKKLDEIQEMLQLR